MKTYLFSFFLVIQTTSIIFAQTRVIGKLINTQQQPLGYVSIGIVGTSIGTVSDEQGRFELYLSAEGEVLFSLIGYRPLKISTTALKTKNTDQPIELEEQPFQLPEIRISNREQVTKMIGGDKVNTSTSTNFAIGSKPSQNLGAEIGRKFNLPKTACRLEKYRFYLQSNFESVKFRVNVYSLKGMVNLLPKNIYYATTGKTNGWVEIDLTPYDIVVNEDVVISIQWIESKGKGSYLQMPIQMPALAVHYYKYGSQDKWKKFNGMTTAMNLTFTYGK
jgi:hypothetical protein